VIDDLEALVARMRAAGEAHRQAMHEVRVDPDRTDDAKERRLRELADAARERVANDRAEADRLHERLRERAKQADSGVPTPSPDAVARVRGLLQQGADPHDVVAMAIELGDGDVIEAMRTEVRWANLGVDVGGLVRRMDEASLALLPPGPRAAREERLRIDTAWGQAKPYIDAESFPDTGPQLGTAVAALYAETPLERPQPLNGLERAVAKAFDADAQASTGAAG